MAEEVAVAVRLEQALDGHVAVVVALGRDQRLVVEPAEHAQHGAEVARLGAVGPPGRNRLTGHALEHVRRAAVLRDALGHVAKHHVLSPRHRVRVDARVGETLAAVDDRREANRLAHERRQLVEHGGVEPRVTRRAKAGVGVERVLGERALEPDLGVVDFAAPPRDLRVVAAKAAELALPVVARLGLEVGRCLESILAVVEPREKVEAVFGAPLTRGLHVAVEEPANAVRGRLDHHLAG